MLKELTKEQEVLKNEVRDYWINRMFNCTNRLDIDKATEAVKWLYKLSGLKEPKVIYAESPLSCIQVANKLKNPSWKEGDKLEWFDFSIYGNCTDYGWVAFYDFFQRIGIHNNENFMKFKELLECNIYDSIQLEDYCILSDMPTRIKTLESKPHCEDGPAIIFSDGLKLYYWRGLPVPESWIMDKNSITDNEILSIDNAEKRRCLMEILGAKKYYQVVAGEDGLKVVDRDIDHQGNEMVLYQTAKKDKISETIIQFLSVICPSTKMTYNLYPLKHDCKNVWEAKASTFNNEKGKYRQGDVMLVSVNTAYDRPVIET